MESHVFAFALLLRLAAGAVVRMKTHQQQKHLSKTPLAFEWAADAFFQWNIVQTHITQFVNHKKSSETSGHH